MSVTCRQGHESATADYCDQCGALIVRADSPSATAELPIESLSPGAGAEACPKCGTTRAPDGQFCEECGYDFVARVGGASIPPLTPSGSAWEVVVAADRAYFDSLGREGIRFPSNHPPRTFRLTASEVHIGRRSTSRGIEPEIDLSGDPEDTGISHGHAVLVRSDDGSYSVIDVGSTNGTTVNDNAAPIAVDVPVPIANGDRVHIGTWTTITIRRIADETGNG